MVEHWKQCQNPKFKCQMNDKDPKPKDQPPLLLKQAQGSGAPRLGETRKRVVRERTKGWNDGRPEY
jgi:hypothetical protein